MGNRSSDEPIDDGRIFQERNEALRILLPIRLADRLDDRLLGGKVAIERAGTHARLGANLLHRSALKARTNEAQLCRFKDTLGLLIATLGARQELPVKRIRLTDVERRQDLPW